MRFILPVSLALIVTCATSPLTAGQSATEQAQVTFTKDVAPILQNNCQACHRPGSIAPMSLLTYEETRPWARSIKQKVVAREMPPWFIDKNVGVQHFSNDRSLTDERDRDDRQVGGRRRAAGESGRHAAAAPVRRRRDVADRQAGSDRDLAQGLRRARPRRPISGPTSSSIRG